MALFGKDKRPVFDTQIFSSYRRHLTRKDFSKMSLSVLVLYELVARPITPEVFEVFDRFRETAVKDNRLIIPTYDDIWRQRKRCEKCGLTSSGGIKERLRRWKMRRLFKMMR